MSRGARRGSRLCLRPQRTNKVRRRRALLVTVLQTLERVCIRALVQFIAQNKSCRTARRQEVFGRVGHRAEIAIKFILLFLFFLFSSFAVGSNGPHRKRGRLEGRTGAMPKKGGKKKAKGPEFETTGIVAMQAYGAFPRAMFCRRAAVRQRPLATCTASLSHPEAILRAARALLATVCTRPAKLVFAA